MAETWYDRHLSAQGRLTPLQSKRMKKGEPLLIFRNGWEPVEFDSTRNVQGSPVVTVLHQGRHLDVYYHDLKVFPTDDLFERWSGE